VSERQDAAGSAGSGKLAGLFREYGHRWEIEHVDPGSAWVAVMRNGSFLQVIAAHDLDELRAELKKAEAEEPMTRPGAGDRPGRRIMSAGDPDDPLEPMPWVASSSD